VRSIGVLLLVSVVSCGSLSLSGSRATRVGRERLLVTRDPARDAYFASVYGHQLALAGVDGRRAELSAALARALELRQNADRATLSAALRAALDRVRVRRVRVRVEASAGLDERVSEWQDALSTPAGDDTAAAIAGRYARVLESVTVTLTPVAAPAGLDADAAAPDAAAPDASAPPASTAGSAATSAPASAPVSAPELAPALDAIAALLRDAVATRHCMSRLVGRTPGVFARGADLRAGSPPELWADFQAAERFVLGMHARATFHQQESVRAQRWILGALRPESEADAEGGAGEDEEEAESAPESGPAEPPG
jgi:hypothetical protein